MSMLATVLLLVGYLFIRRGKVTAHRNTMLSAFAVSVLFLACYLTYHSYHLTKKFPPVPVLREIYWVILGTHVILAAAVPFLAVVTIWRALVHDPKIVLMDEPFGALDAMTRERMNVELMRIQRETGKTVLLITHSIPEAVFLADRVLVMTERPGAIAAIYDVPLPRPRSLDVMADPVFLELVQRIRKHFFTQSALD